MRPLNDNLSKDEKCIIGFNAKKLAERIDDFVYFWSSQTPAISQDEAWKLWSLKK